MALHLKQSNEGDKGAATHVCFVKVTMEKVRIVGHGVFKRVASLCRENIKQDSRGNAHEPERSESRKN